jgi:hypothetical protein
MMTKKNKIDCLEKESKKVNFKDKRKKAKEIVKKYEKKA